MLLLLLPRPGLQSLGRPSPQALGQKGPGDPVCLLPFFHIRFNIDRVTSMGSKATQSAFKPLTCPLLLCYVDKSVSPYVVSFYKMGDDKMYLIRSDGIDVF